MKHHGTMQWQRGDSYELELSKGRPTMQDMSLRNHISEKPFQSTSAVCQAPLGSGELETK